jgi:hypothetical protein
MLEFEVFPSSAKSYRAVLRSVVVGVSPAVDGVRPALGFASVGGSVWMHPPGTHFLGRVL